MSRNTAFNPEREPMRSHESLQLDKSRVTGPFSFLNPTQAHFHHINTTGVPQKDKQEQDSDKTEEHDDDENPTTTQNEPGQAASNVSYKWTSRNNRKGRHALVVKPTAATSPDATYDTPPLSTSIRHILYTCWLMFAYYPVWDISWWVAYIFTWGSIIWVINAFFSFLPDTNPSTTFKDEVLTGGGVSAFIGATVFEIGSILLVIEAVNENRAGCFGWAVEQLFETDSSSAEKGTGPRFRIRPSKDKCSHHHANKKNFVGAPHENAINDPSVPTGQEPQSWTWFPSSYELRTHYAHDLGFIACMMQLFGASVFWISGFTALPGINNKFNQAALDGAYWFPQVLGGCGFILSGLLFMIETQKHWYMPAFNVLGWHIGLWNLIGGVGFTLCPAFGFDTSSWAQYQASCSTFWGSWAFLIGSAIQLYESLEKNPVEVEKEKK